MKGGRAALPVRTYCRHLLTFIKFFSVVGKNLLETAEVCRLRRGNYIGVKQKDFSVPPSDTDLCFYAPDLVDKCLPSEDFLSCGCDDEQMCYTHKCQHKREDVIYDDDHRQLRIFNFRMMPPDDERDAAFVIRLYNNTVVWLMMNGSCSTTSLVLSNIWKPTRYILDEDYPTIANSFTLTTSAEGTVSSCLVNLKQECCHESAL